MLLIVTLGLVVASLVLLIIGFVQDHLGYIYISMLCAGVAGVALIVFARLARRRAAVVAGRGVSIPETGPASDVDDTAENVVPAATSRRSQSADSDEIERTGSVAILEPTTRTPAFVPPPASRTAPTATGDGWEADAGDDWEDDWGDEVVFPIEDYDDLRVAEILPLIPQLEQDELQEVRDREAAGKNRATIIDRIDERLGRTEAAAGAAPVKSTQVKKAARDTAAPARRAAGAPRAAASDATATAKKATTPAKRAAGPRKATASDTAAPAKKATGTAKARAAAATKSVPTKSAATKSAATKSAATKSAARRATATRASAGKAASSNSTGGKAAGTAKKATKKATGARKTS